MGGDLTLGFPTVSQSRRTTPSDMPRSDQTGAEATSIEMWGRSWLFFFPLGHQFAIAPLSRIFRRCVTTAGL